MENIKELHSSYFSIPHSFCPATYSAPIECSISINNAVLFMDVPHCFFHCNKELYHSMLFVMTVTGWLHFEELQHRCHVSGTYANLYTEWGSSNVYWNNSFLALLLTEKKIVGHYFFGQPLYLHLLKVFQSKWTTLRHILQKQHLLKIHVANDVSP